MAASPEVLAQRVLDRCEHTEDGCWLFQGALSRGYARISTYDGTTRKQIVQQGHRVVYEHLIGPIPEGLVLDHLCKNRNCVNPEHLEPVTPEENTERAVEIQRVANAAKTHCPKGHPYTRRNTYTPKGSNSRYCRECGRIASRKWRKKINDRFTR